MITRWRVDGHLGDAAVHEMLGAELARLIRSADRTELLAAAVELDAAAEAAGESSAIWSFAAGQLEAAAGAVGDTSLPMHLRGHAGKSEQVLRCVAERGGTAARKDIAAALTDVTDSHLSHILGDLDNAGLLIRSREGREIVVMLTAKGNEALGHQTTEDLFAIGLAQTTELVRQDGEVAYRLRQRTVGWATGATL